ncbi:serine/threonine protein phosphatase superfamily protein, putative (macronuclear) [Tetrahymena thermophila SB210]|uniref:Serine/threonine-protein phosphatase T n=1 Tax=Tetrahymena thermophila (strain SB210) TaxID=312017 RepID=Q22B29_TETTS|nr:serine/threonine protein phosphatase superfamily protein, putative [Tetrahymena thermophila SB210]EAR82479.1 serine/threonine protein phosphatase superfamily protein, putative [Tetrahymena thermophila SB210]|eukprot:XP_001030142.1 serine/threonine protein phosphatase superfamily protein, putative [Tetrahymena thermophila SB210]
MDTEDFQQAEEFKQKGNDCFKHSKYQEASDFYTKAIDCHSTSPKAAPYYSNRAFCQLKLENYGLALEDSKTSIKLDPNFVKGYYREGSAYLALGKLEDARNSFKAAHKLQPKDTDINEKLKKLKQMIYEKEFLKSIEIQHTPLVIHPEDIIVEPSYNGPKLEEDNQEITAEWVLNLMNWMKDQKKLHKKYVWILIKRCNNILKQYKALIDLDYGQDEKLTVCGDIHGQYYDLLNIFSLNGNPSPSNPYLFNGDFVDRGSFSVECILTLIAWKVHNPNVIHFTRGNHESKNMNKMYGFEGEVIHKYDSKTMEFFSDFFQNLPLCYVLNKKVMVNHGGLFSNDGVTLEDIRAIDRYQEPPDTGLMTDLLWSDPVKQNGRHPSKRGISIGFGPDVAQKFLADNKLELLVRSHEMKENGYEIEADGKVITVFSAPNYCDQMGNKGAYIIFKGSDMKPDIKTFSAVEHPKVPPMAYSRNFLNLF